MKNQNNHANNQSKASDIQFGGTHYKDMGDFQPWDVLAKWLTPEEYRGYQKGVAIAYLARERSKGGDQDIQKAIHHLQRLVEEFDAADKTKPSLTPKDKLLSSLLEENRRDNSGWQIWNGGECPISLSTMVEVQFRNGQRRSDFPASVHDWLHMESAPLSDIVAYRVMEK